MIWWYDTWLRSAHVGILRRSESRCNSMQWWTCSAWDPNVTMMPWCQACGQYFLSSSIFQVLFNICWAWLQYGAMNFSSFGATLSAISLVSVYLFVYPVIPPWIVRWICKHSCCGPLVFMSRPAIYRMAMASCLLPCRVSLRGWGWGRDVGCAEKCGQVPFDQWNQVEDDRT